MKPQRSIPLLLCAVSASMFAATPAKRGAEDAVAEVMPASYDVSTTPFRMPRGSAVTHEPRTMEPPSEPLPSAPGAENLIATVRARTGNRFNTSDGSHPNDFAICYRLSPRMGLQVIPGDPTPNKLPVTTLANNMGVTVGMTIRLGRSR